MAIQQYGFYTKNIIPDGTSTSVSLDFFEQIAGDNTIANKNPVSVYLANDSLGKTSANGTLSASVSGTVVTFVWPTAPSIGSYATMNVGVYLLFSAE